MNIAYVVSDLKQVGPTNQTFNIINNSTYKDTSIVITLFPEPTDTMLETYRRNSIKIIQLNLSRKTFLLNGKHKLKKVLSEKNINLVHTSGTIPDNLCQKICQELDIPHVITLRNCPKEDIPQRMNFLKSHLALHSIFNVLKNGKYIVACSKTIQKKMEQDFPNMNISAIQNGVDVEKYQKVSLAQKVRLRKKLGLPQDKQIIISTSGFIKRKRIDESIDGFMKSNLENTALLFIGDGDQFKRISQKYQNNDNTIFKGKVTNVNEYLNASDAFVSSSESEGLPNGVIEAIAAGLPVLLSNIPQHEEALSAVPHSGLTYQLGDISDLSEKFSDILKYNNSKSDIVSSALTMSNMSKKYVEYYQDIFNAKGAKK